MTNHGSMDMPAHKQMYADFIKLVKYGSVGVITLLVIMAITLI